MKEKQICNPVMFAAFKHIIRKRYEKSLYNKKASIRYIISYMKKYRLSIYQIIEVNEICRMLK
jgi:hypothetical protein|nr:MAG TPA: hypothetical protein [Caudoviricetes sp.]